ncbi:hypothetical protein [Pseudonocardia humida]|uniref:Uncharacterized protein n=1 Tax=Pseudonocardia humida TaxID=2800819 RepID=A0ABT1A4B9_9PSEU|nr:hypothetical protein [Pseudonocardia humida]MCO1657689.1 hypothetical protein [Pseudonocardia humida]
MYVLIPAGNGEVAKILADLSRLLGMIALIIAILILVYQRYLKQLWTAELAKLSGPAILATLLPAQALSPLLSNLYGNSGAIQDVVHAVLGGEGQKPGGQDLCISTNTTIEYVLSSEVPGTYRLSATIEYNFHSSVADDRMTLFMTCDPRLRDIIATGCGKPLYDWWYIPDREMFDESTKGMLQGVEIAARYRDSNGRKFSTELTPVEPRYVPFDEWPEHLAFFRSDVGSIPQQDPRLYMGTLRIYEYDLTLTNFGDLTSEAAIMHSVDGLITRSSSLNSTEDGYCYWQPPYPCFVDKISLDVSGLQPEFGGPYEFHVAPFTFRAWSVPNHWTNAAELQTDLQVRSWMLPGHGFALLWRQRPENYQSGSTAR